MNAFRQILHQSGYTERPGVTWDTPQGSPEPLLRLWKCPAMEHLTRHHQRPDVIFALEKTRRQTSFLDCNFTTFEAWLLWYQAHGEKDGKVRLLSVARSDKDFAEEWTCEKLDTSIPEWLIVDWTRTAANITEGLIRVPLSGKLIAYFQPG